MDDLLLELPYSSTSEVKYSKTDWGLGGARQGSMAHGAPSHFAWERLRPWKVVQLGIVWFLSILIWDGVRVGRYCTVQ